MLGAICTERCNSLKYSRFWVPIPFQDARLVGKGMEAGESRLQNGLVNRVDYSLRLSRLTRCARIVHKSPIVRRLLRGLMPSDFGLHPLPAPALR